MASDAQTVEEIFGEALEIESPDERTRYLDGACAGNPAVRAEVEALLAGYRPDDSFLEKPAPGLPVPIREKPGDVIGGYTLERVLGEGGFGIVFLARQRNPVRPVALKVIKPGMDTARVIARFGAERQALALMDHPSIAKIFEAGETASGRPYFVMEYVDGTPITEFCDAHEAYRSPQARLGLFMEVCRAVQHAHQKGVIHRDIKPSNVMVALRGGTPVVKVIDFGLAKAMDRTLTLESLLFSHAGIHGTPAYMSPEQAATGGENVDTRSDVYSLGVLLFELLTGTTPRDTERLVAAGLEQLLKIIQEDEAPRPSSRLSALGDSAAAFAGKRGLDLKRLVQLLANDLDWVVMKALDRERDRRYGSPADFVEDIERYLHGEPVRACPPTARYRLRKFARKHRRPLAAGAAFVTLLLAAVAATTWLAVARGRAEAAAIGDRDKAEVARAAAVNATAAADAARNDAVAAGNAANAARESELRELYAADTLLASRAVIDGPLSRAIDLLDGWLPERRGGKDYRGPEWHLLRRLCSTSELTLVGHDGPLAALAWSNDGKRLASGGADRVVRVWDADAGGCLRTLAGHSAGVFDVAFSPDGTRLVSAGVDTTVRVWDVESGRELHVVRGHILPVYAVAFHPDGKRFASAGGDTVVKVWDADSGAELDSLQGHDTPVGRLQFDAAGERLASCGLIRGTLIWDLKARAVVDRLTQPGDYRFTPDFGKGLFAFPTGEFGVQTVEDKGIDQGGLGLQAIHALDMNRTARVVAAAGADDSIRVVDREAFTTLATHRGHVGPARRVALRGDARKLAGAGADGTVRVWDVPDPAAPVPYSGFHEHNVTAAAFSRDGALLASGDYLGGVAVWDAVTGKRRLKLGSHYLRRKSQPVALEVGTGKPIEEGKTPIKSYTRYSAGTTVRDPIIECFTSEGHAGEVAGVAFTPDNRTVVSAGAVKLMIWDATTGALLKEHEHPALVSSLSLSPDGTLAATGCWDGTVRVFRVPSGELVAELEGHAHNVMSVAFHPSGKELVSGGRDHDAIVWDVETRKVKHRLHRHANTVAVVRYTPDGRRLVTGGMDKALHVWDAATGGYESSLHGHAEGVTNVAFSADGRWLVTASDGSHDTAAHLWLWNAGRYREGAVVESGGNKGPTALAVHPATGNLLMGRNQLKAFATKPLTARPPTTAPAAPAETPSDDRLKVLGYALVDEIAAWPGGDKGRVKPEKPDGRFLVVAASLPFGRLKPTDFDYQHLLAAHRADPDAPLPLRLNSVLIDPRRFVLAGAGDAPVPAQFVGRTATTVRDGFEFMPKGTTMLENMTDPPRPGGRELVLLAWEVGPDPSTENLRLRFAGDDPVTVPALTLEKFRPGKPFHTATRGFDVDEGGLRLRSNATRSPVP